MNCNDPECDSCNPEVYCEDHALWDQNGCPECLNESEQEEVGGEE